MAYTGTYEQELRKNPTDYKLRAMGKRRYNLKRKKDERGKTRFVIVIKNESGKPNSGQIIRVDLGKSKQQQESE